MSIDHYENFPVASVLCPPSLRPAVVAIYHFARTADDIADEGDAPESQRLADLAAYRIELQRCAAGEPAQDARWLHVFGPLAVQMRRFALPPQLLADLLSAFEQDTGNPRYPDRATLLDYCRRSADPIGRLLLHLYGVRDAVALQQSDAICSALQLINFWQDFSVDLPRGRHYAPVADAARHGLTLEQLQMQQDSPATRTLVRELCLWARELMLSGAPLVHRLPGRAGWELRLVVQGGLRILEKIEQMNHATLARRPKLAALDAPRLLWRALGMRARPATARSPA
ncbi:squalene synthase HpnC [Azohydromonas lata]|uniref:squalene synthase HpnC n=1 Tax=Azohydromonas lata TaxID=45677 RepID=UPI000A024DD5|nr:squalene synthase HpnC [Azohydromonas lata]